MIIDHIGWVFFPEQLWIHIIGRISFPLYAITTAYGIINTSNRKKYILKILGMALISEFFFDFLFYSKMNFNHQNILFSFVIAAGSITAYEYLEKKSSVKMDKYIVLIIGCILSDIFRIDYGFLGTALIISLYFIYKNKNSLHNLIKYLPLACFVLLKAIDALLSQSSAELIILIGYLPVLFFINHSQNLKKTQNRKLSMVLFISYPLHLIVLLTIKYISSI